MKRAIYSLITVVFIVAVSFMPNNAWAADAVYGTGVYGTDTYYTAGGGNRNKFKRSLLNLVKLKKESIDVNKSRLWWSLPKQATSSYANSYKSSQ